MAEEKDFYHYRWGEYRDEADFQKAFLHFLKEKLKANLEKAKLEIGEKRLLIKDSIITENNGEGRINFGASESDIVIYRRCENLSKFFGKPPSEIKLSKSIKEFIYPYVIFELKQASDKEGKRQGTISHELLVYSRKAAEWKERFPLVKCYFVSGRNNKSELTLLRQLKNFDGVYTLTKFNGEKKRWVAYDIDMYIIDDVKRDLEKVERRLKNP